MGGFREVSLLFLVCFPSWPAELRVMVNLYNGVNLPSSELSRAEREAERFSSTRHSTDLDNRSAGRRPHQQRNE